MKFNNPTGELVHLRVQAARAAEPAGRDRGALHARLQPDRLPHRRLPHPDRGLEPGGRRRGLRKVALARHLQGKKYSDVVDFHLLGMFCP